MILSRPVALSRTAPVADLYRLNASASDISLCPPICGKRSLTRGKQNKGGSSVDNTGSSREDGSRAVLDGLVDAPVLVSWVSRRGGAIKLYVRYCI